MVYKIHPTPYENHTPRMVGISIITANLVRLGRLIREKERERLKRQQRRAA